MADHGTYAQYQVEKRAGLVPCDACREANNANQRQRRQPGTTAHAKNQALRRVRDEAIRELLRRHRAEYHRIYAGLREDS